MTMKAPEMSCKDHAACCANPVAHPICARKCNKALRCALTGPDVPGGHCKGVIEKEVGKIEGVSSVSADPTTKDVVVCNQKPGHVRACQMRLRCLQNLQ